MNEDVKQLWTTALRSGDYRQSKGKLHLSNNTFCCLGVLCDIAVKNNVIAAPELGTGLSSEYYVYDDDPNVLSERVRNWAELDRNDPYVQTAYGKKPLSILNDRGVSFTQIADLIEGQL